MQQLILQVANEVGLHARPAAEFVKLAARFKSGIQIRNLTRSSTWVDAKSILSVLGLGVERDHEIALMVEGPDEMEAVEALRALIDSDFNGKS
jgi:phosphotransferase system HPr (HPr) family protein